MLVLDSGAITHLAKQNRASAALIRALRDEGLWPPVAPSVVLVECLTGDGARDATTHRLLNTVDIVEALPTPLARRAAQLRTKSRHGSAVDAVVIASAEPGGTVLTADAKDLGPLAAHADRVTVELL
jgi:hypothetical protein